MYTMCNGGGIGLCGEQIQDLYTVYLIKFQTYKICFTTPNKNLGGKGADKHLPPISLYRSIFKKSRHLGLESINYLVHVFVPNETEG
jgi:hypothetical protein